MSLTHNWFIAVGINSRTRLRNSGSPWHPVPHLKPITVDDVFEPVPSDPLNIWEITLVHIPQLHAADSRIHSPYVMDIFKDERLLRGFSASGFPFVLMICLLAYAKQSAQRLDAVLPRVACMQVLYCLAPAFFRIWMSNFFSATLIISS